jgi:hypothetical protein
LTTLEEGLVGYLRADPAVAALTGTRQYFNRLPQNPVYPSLRLQRVSTPRLMTLGGPSGLAAPRFQIDCYADHHAEALALAEAVRAALDGFHGAMNGAAVLWCSSVDEAGEWEEAVNKSRQRIDLVFGHKES